jgi:hypothetical protein
MFLNGVGHTVFALLGCTLPSVTFSRSAPGFYSGAIAIRGLCLANEAAPPHRIRIPARRPCIGTNAPPRTIPNAGPDVAPILCYDR